MSEIEASDTPARPDTAGDNLPVRDWWAEPDRSLGSLVALVNKLEFGLSVRVFVGAGVLSGDLIGVGQYFELLATELEETSNEEGAVITNALASMYRESATALREKAKSDDLEQEAAHFNDVRHLHLRDASLHVPGQGPLSIGLWRGRLADVSGWCLGSYGA